MLKGMNKNSDLITQAEFSRFKDCSRALICQKVKAKKLNTVWMNGNIVIKLTPDELVEYKKWKESQFS